MITDGVFALPDASAVDSLLAQLRASTVCCSFIKVGSGFHAHCRYVTHTVEGFWYHTKIFQNFLLANFPQAYKFSLSTLQARLTAN